MVVTVQSAFAGSSKVPGNGFGHTVLNVNTVSADTAGAAGTVNPFQTPMAVTWFPVPDASTTISTDTGDLLLVRFSAQSLCAGGSGSWCAVRIMDSLNGGAPIATVFQPQPTPNPPSAGFFAFDVPGPSTVGAARSMEVFAQSKLKPGSHDITVEISAQGPAAISAQVSNWTLTVERAG
jgi:hypothetical protein